MFPNLYISGRIYTGKTKITQTLARDYGYHPIYSGDVLLDTLQQVTGELGPFSNERVVAMRETLTQKYGPLYILRNAPIDTPIVIDGIRSTDIAYGLTDVGFLAVHVGASFNERLENAGCKRENHSAKEVLISEYDISMRDATHDPELEVISMIGRVSFINTKSRPIETLIGHILDSVCLQKNI